MLGGYEVEKEDSLFHASMGFKHSERRWGLDTARHRRASPNSVNWRYSLHGRMRGGIKNSHYTAERIEHFQQASFFPFFFSPFSPVPLHGMAWHAYQI